MSIYLVRWPDLSASLVQVDHEEHLLDILDQVGNPDDCEWNIYDGQLFIDFRLPVEWSIQDDRRGTPVAPAQIVLSNVDRVASGNVVEALQVCLADGDDGYETGAEILRLAFPKLHAAIERSHEAEDSSDAEGALPEAEVREALHAELERILRSSWRRAQLGNKPDRISRLAREMDLSVKLVRQYTEIAQKEEGAGHEEGTLPDEERAVKPPLFRVSNHHVDDCGPAPAVDGDEQGKYFGYFANPHGEQAVFVYDHQAQEASVRMGDAGWGDAHRVVDGRVEGIILTESETAWVRACWLAATEGS